MEETPLEKATRHVMNGVRILARQRRLIAQLQADGRDTILAEALLSTLIATQDIFEDDLQEHEKSGLGNRVSKAMTPVSSRPGHDTCEPRSVKLERIARAMSVGMARAAQAGLPSPSASPVSPGSNR